MIEKKITEMLFKNYKAFYNIENSEPYKISLPKGENLLIYGENGSGKSSLYQALYDFLESSIDANKTFKMIYFILLILISCLIVYLMKSGHIK